jgi:hypothetical protein
MIDHAQGVFSESTSETGEGRMIGSWIVEGKTKELFERSSVVDLGLQFRIGIDLEPLLKKKAFHKEKRRIGIVSFKAFTDGIASQKQAFDSGPVDSGVDLPHSFDGPVLFHGSKERYIGKGEISFHIFEAHNSSKRFYLKKLCLKRKNLSSYIYNNIKILALHNHKFAAESMRQRTANAN